MNNIDCLNNIQISDIFSLFNLVKFNINLKSWNILVLATLWSLWLNKNAIIFRQRSKNLSSLFYQILYLTSCWVDNLLTGQGSGSSSISQAIQQMQHDWDQIQAAQAITAPIAPSIGFSAAAEDLNNPSDLTLDSTGLLLAGLVIKDL